MQKKFKDLGTRFFSALAMSAVCFLPVYYGGVAFAGLAVLIGIRIVYEWVRMSDPGSGVMRYILPVAAFLGALAAFVFELWPLVWGFVIGGALLCTLERVRRGGALWAGFGVLYLLLPCLAMLFIRGDIPGASAAGFQKFFFVLLIVVGADVGAYIGGSIIGGPKIAPLLSPKKTWSGFFSGLVLGCLISAACAYFIGFPIVIALILAVPIVVLSVIGDFLESGIKRKLDVKDAGSLLPGHGGVLDRIDSLMFAMGFFALALILNPQIWPV